MNSFDNVISQLQKVPKQDCIREKCVDFIIQDCQPLNAVESPAFRHMMKAAYNEYEPISNQDVKQMIYTRAKEIREAIVKAVGNNVIAITTDHWTSISNDSYEGMTIHWIDHNFILHSLPVGCFLHEGDTTSMSLV